MTQPEMKARHNRLPPDAVIHTRQPLGTQVSEQETVSEDFARLGLARLLKQLSELNRIIDNRSKPVDEYQTGSPTVSSAAPLTVQPTFEYMPEKIESVIVTGPPAGTATLQLGDRSWSVVVPASGVLVVAPVGILLSRSDTRQLTPSAPGVWGLELMGIADQRFNV